MLTLTLRVTQKHAIHPPKIINTPFMCSDLFQKFPKGILGYTKRKKRKKIYNIHAKGHERKRRYKDARRKKERKSIAHLLHIS